MECMDDSTMEDDIQGFHYERTVEEVRQVIGYAKLDELDLQPLSQVVSFSTHLLGDEVKLVQVSKAMADSLELGDTLILRGEEDEGVVLCSNIKTYDFKEAETSNSLLILPNLSLSKDVQGGGERILATRTVSGVFYKYYELQEIRPRVQKLRAVLTTLTETHLRDGTGTGTSWSKLLNVIQASEEELTQGLSTLEAVQYKESWFVLDQEYQMKVLSYILRFFEENSWPLDCVHKQETVTTLQDLVNSEILSQVFDIYCSPMLGGEPDEFSLDKGKVCRFFGDYLLSPGSNFTVDEFLDMWQKAVPEGLKTDLNQLSGLVLTDTSSTPHKIRRFAEADLPNNIQDRLDVLFRTRERWSVEDITPYIQPLTTIQLNVNAILTKYARPVNANGVKFFCAKHGK